MRKLDQRAQGLSGRWLQAPSDLALVANSNGVLPPDLVARMERAGAEAEQLGKTLNLPPQSAKLLDELMVRYELRQNTFVEESVRHGGSATPEQARAVARKELLDSLRLTRGLGPDVQRAVTPVLERLP
jgi:hypothetical protein